MDFMTDLKADHNENIARLSHCLKRHEHTFHHPYLRPARLRRSTKPPLTPTLDASQRLKQLSIGSTMQQGLVLTTAAVFISSNPPLPKEVNYSSSASYACLAESLVFLLFGLLFQLKVSASGFIFQKHSATEIIIERIFWHLWVWLGDEIAWNGEFWKCVKCFLRSHRLGGCNQNEGFFGHTDLLPCEALVYNPLRGHPGIQSCKWTGIDRASHISILDQTLQGRALLEDGSYARCRNYTTSTPATSTPATSMPATSPPATSPPTTSPPTISPPPEIATLSPQRKSIPKPCPIRPAGTCSSSAPSAPPPKPDTPAPTSDKTKKRKSGVGG
ncbi:hypothetical protein BD769DRAFT_1671065 [Suillus cothurnatus]|nr:hypothetical protein BD769DRAFT_1671065 [Suillus cothurnatus]